MTTHLSENSGQIVGIEITGFAEDREKLGYCYNFGKVKTHNRKKKTYPQSKFIKTN